MNFTNNAAVTIKNIKIADAARKLIAMLDYTNPGWRTDTLGQTEHGDEVNAAWDALVSAIEGEAR